MNELTNASINFMSALKNEYGPEQGLALFNAIGEHLPPEVQHNVIVALLVGFSGDITLISVNTALWVEGIKTLRAVWGLGLKEAKDISDLVLAGKPQTLRLPPGCDIAQSSAQLRPFFTLK